MKQLFVWALAIVLFASCHNYKKDAERLQSQRDSLSNEVSAKDSSIVGFLNDFNEIMTVLDSIKQVEKQVTVQSATTKELNFSQKQQILEDIDLLNNLLQKNKQQVAQLQKKLRSSNYQVGKLKAMVQQLEQMVTNLQKQIEEKDGEIVLLNQKVAQLTGDVERLNEKIAAAEAENTEKEAIIEQQTKAINQAWYVLGNSKELKENGVIEKSGGFLGIGRSLKMKKDFNREAFTGVDVREFKFLPLNSKKARVISVHPANSYHISGSKTADTLFVDQPQEFWSVSKYLVIELD